MNIASLLVGLDEKSLTCSGSSLAPSRLRPNSCLIQDHVETALAIFRARAEIDPLVYETRHALYAQLISKSKPGHRALQLQLQGSGLNAKLDPASAAVLADNIMANTALLPSSLNPSLRTHVFQVSHNAVATLSRDRWRISTSTLCYLCRRSEESMDHLLECPATRAALAIILNNSKDRSTLTELETSLSYDFSLRVPCSNQHLLVQRVVLSFAVWTTRQSFRHKPDSADRLAKASEAIAALFFSNIPSFTPRAKYHKPRTGVIVLSSI